MLHKIELPTYDQNLERIVQIQQKIISFVCDPNTPITPGEDAFKQVFNDQIGIWLYNWLQKKHKEKTFYEELCSLIAYLRQYSSLRTQLIDAFQNDIDFFNHLDDASFVFFFSTRLRKKVRQMIAPVMIAFYDDVLRTGFPSCIATFDRKTFLKIFWTTNKNLGVCPACDCPKPDINDQYINCDIDHFLPKSLYPFLSMHASNLVPICTDCNRYVKGKENPIDQALTAPLTNTFHPFGKPALDVIKVAVNRKTKGGEYQIYLEETTGGISRRVASLKRVYKLDTRWFERLKAEIESIRKIIKNAGKRFLQKGMSANDIVDVLLNTILDDYDQKIGVEHFYILQSSYAHYALCDTEEFASLVELLS